MGDLDSLKPAVKEHYQKLGVPINKDPDQYSTDFTKCLKYLNENASEIIATPRKQAENATNAQNNADSDVKLEMVILGGLGGRVDQAFSQVHHLYMMTQTQREIRESQQGGQDKENNESKPNPAAGGNLYLVSEESITFVLQKGKNIIHTPATRRPQADTQQSECDETPESRKRKRSQEPGRDSVTNNADDSPEYLFEENIGIIPLSAPAWITTQGFEWDVENWHTEIGGQLSTSNHIRADVVSVETSVPVLFTVELAERLKR
jgi:thiamine pyrophosphokinase